MTANYSTDGLRERAAEAVHAYREYVKKTLKAYEEKLAARVSRGVPTIALLGMGRAGKDTAAEYLAHRLGLSYGGSSSTNLCCFVSHLTGLTEEEAWAERHQHREFWIATGHAVRGNDLTLLCRMALGLCDFAVGLRGKQELYGCLQQRTIDAAVWIDNPRVPSDPTVEFTAADCDLMVPNHGSVTEFYRKLDKLICLLKLDLTRGE